MVNWRKVFSLPALGASDPLHIHEVLGFGSATVAAWYAGNSSSGDLLDITGNGRTLEDTSSPPTVYSNLCLYDGNKAQAYDYDGSADFHSVADAAWQDVTTGTYVVVLSADSGAADTLGVFSHLETDVGGYGIYVDAGVVKGRWDKNTGNITASAPSTDIRDGRYHIVHVTVDSGNTATAYLDGVAGTPVSITGYGGACAATFYVGAGCGSYFNGKIVYTRLQNSAMTASQVAREVSLWKGIGLSVAKGSAATFTRAGKAFQIYHDGSMSLRANTFPRVEDGVLVEKSSTNILGATRQRTFTDASWTKYKISATGGAATGPDGTASMSSLLETADDNIHAVFTDPSIEYTAVVHTVHAIMKPAGRNFGGFRCDFGGSPGFVIWNLATGVNTLCETGWSNANSVRLSSSCWLVWANFTGTGSGFYVGPAVSSDGTTTSYAGDVTKGIYATDVVVETGSFPTTATDPSTGSRVADSLTMESSLVLPAEISHSGHYKKIRVKCDFKHYSLSAMGAGETATIFEVGGNTGTAGETRNRIRVFVYGSNFYVALYENADATQRFTSKAMSTFNAWNTVDYTIDLSDLSASSGTINGVALVNDATMTGSDKHFMPTDTAIRVGQIYDGTTNGNCYIRNMEILVA